MANHDGHRRERRPAWARLASGIGPVVVPLVVPVILLAGVLAWSLARDAEPGGFGEPPTGLVPGAVTVTGWHQADMSLVPDGYGRGDPGHASPRALIDAMVGEARQAAGGEPWITGAILSEDVDAARARVYLPLPELSAAYVAGEQVLELAVKSDGWYVEDSNVRFHCRRAVRDAVCG
ncbi:MAG TPA: hypothetical protein VLA59_10050 [Patescibacteria group bacterium]|nr:hypothetical protein [Patescibacteria group bacterium]